MSERMVRMDDAQYADIERYIEVLMRANQNERASRMMNLALAYKFAGDIQPQPPSNVIQIDDWSRKVGA